MMKHVTPHADLPPTNHAPSFPNTVPTRGCPQSSTKNMTGIYLGTEPCRELPSKPLLQAGIPPLARARGIPRRPRTPSEQRRYRMVELLRVKEDRRGFQGNSPVKPRRCARSPEPEPTLPQLTPEEVAIWEITKQTPRRFTPTTNAGVSRLENLSPAHAAVPHIPSCPGGSHKSYSLGEDTPNMDTVAQEVHRLATSGMSRRELVGLVECYRKVCKGNINSLQSLLPARPAHERGKNPAMCRYTGFTVKSYRNPNQAEIMAEFPRPATVLGSSVQRPHAPSPYFFKSYAPPRALSSKFNQYPDNESPPPSPSPTR